MEKLKPRAVIFDLGSTLIEYESDSWESLSIQCAANVRKFLDKRGYSPPEEQEFFQMFEDVKNELRRTATKNLTEWTVPQAASKLLVKLEMDVADGFIDDLFEAYYKPVAAKLYAYDDVLDTLTKIKARVGTIGLISNTIFPEDTHRAELKKFGIAPFLDFTIFSSTFGLRKPHPDIFYKAANLAGCAPAECVYIGDRYVEDYRGPTEMGMNAILKLWPRREYPEDMPADVPTITCLSGLDNYLDI
jgi:HAD superfamily hydrolase (TIGR01549 family)